MELLKNNNKINIVSEYSNEQLLSIEILQDYDKYDLKNPISVGSRVNAIFQALPMGQVVYQNKLLDGAYKVVMPKGVGGKLMEYKNGLLGTPVIGDNNKIQV